MREPHVRPNNENKSKPYSTMHEGTTTHKGSTVHEDSGLHDDSIDCIMFELTCSRRIPHSGCWAWLAGGSKRKWVGGSRHGSVDGRVAWAEGRGAT